MRVRAREINGGYDLTSSDPKSIVKNKGTTLDLSHLRSWLEVFGLVVRSGSFGIGWLPASVWLDLSTLE